MHYTFSFSFLKTFTLFQAIITQFALIVKHLICLAFTDQNRPSRDPKLQSANNFCIFVRFNTSVSIFFARCFAANRFRGSAVRAVYYFSYSVLFTFFCFCQQRLIVQSPEDGWCVCVSCFDFYVIVRQRARLRLLILDCCIVGFGIERI